MLARHIEEASLNAWPALQQAIYDGWLLRFSRGYTKRANSVNAFFASHLDVEIKVDLCEKRYEERGLPVIFRITPFSMPPRLDRVLIDRGYACLDTTLVMHLDLLEVQFDSPVGELRRESLDDWLSFYCRLCGVSEASHQTHREIVQAIAGERFLVTLVDGGRAVACVLGVLESPYFGLFDLVADPERRSRGHATALLSGLLKWAQERGARHAYLQVTEINAPARHVYEKLGFQESYRYWYRVRTT